MIGCTGVEFAMDYRSPTGGFLHVDGRLVLPERITIHHRLSNLELVAGDPHSRIVGVENRIADHEGRVHIWLTRFQTSRLWEDLSGKVAFCTGEIWGLDDPTLDSESLVLSADFVSDSRSHMVFRVCEDLSELGQDHIVSHFNHYSGGSLEIAYSRGRGVLVVKAVRYPIFDSEPVELWASQLPLYFDFDERLLWRSIASFASPAELSDPDVGFSRIPLPIRFRPLDERRIPQAGVRLIGQ